MLRVEKTSHLNSSVLKTILFTILTWFMTYTPLPILKLIMLIVDVSAYWIRCFINKVKNSPEQILLRRLNNSTNWIEFSKTAFEIDNLFHNDVWKDNLISSKYDYRLIQERLHDLHTARVSNNTTRLLSLLRAGMLRNFGGISNKSLYNRTYIGTKSLIEQYNREISNCLDSLDNDGNIDNQTKLDFYHDAKTTLGTSALCLHGGSLFGFCHIGVIKGMIECNLLPNVIVGSGVGSAVGAFVCCFEITEVEKILKDLKSDMEMEGLGLAGESDGKLKSDQSDKYLRWIDNLKKGLTTEIVLFIGYVFQKIGKLTFKEAYEKSGKIFNILVYPSSAKIPTLLNYLSTPYITIESAICCSLGTGVLDFNEDGPFDAQLMIKYGDEVKPYSDLECNFYPPYQVNRDSVDLKNSPYNRITELFNVNHFVVSISRPYLASSFIGSWKTIYKNRTVLKKLMNLLNLELKHRIRLLNKLGLLTTTMRWLLVDEKYVLLDTNHVPILPVGNQWIIWDLINLFVQDHSVLDYWVSCGERSVYGIFSLLETRFRMEFLLDQYYEKYRKID